MKEKCDSFTCILRRLSFPRLKGGLGDLIRLVSLRMLINRKSSRNPSVSGYMLKAKLYVIVCLNFKIFRRFISFND